MDILTPKGQETLKQEWEAVQMFLNRFPKYEWVDTPKDKPADIDGFICWDGTLISAVEVKCRDMTSRTLFGDFNGEWLVTADKIERGIAVANSLGVDFRGFLYLVPEKQLLIVKIWQYGTGLVCNMRKAETRTQATVNGGMVERVNAYIDVTTAIRLLPSADI